MTLLKLHKVLGNLIDQGHGRKQVLVSKTTFSHPLEGDGCTCLPVEAAYDWCIEMLDEDGGLKFNKDNSQAMKSVILLAGQTRKEQQAIERDSRL